MNQKLPRTRRLTNKKEFDRVFSNGKQVTYHGISAWLVPGTQARLGCAVSKKYGNSVQRNKFKRLARAVFRHNYDRLPALDVVITTRITDGKTSYKDLEGLINSLISHDTAKKQNGNY